jgi:hypothetical protein
MVKTTNQLSDGLLFPGDWDHPPVQPGRFGHDHGGFLEIALESNPWRRMACVIGGGLTLGTDESLRLHWKKNIY